MWVKFTALVLLIYLLAGCRFSEETAVTALPSPSPTPRPQIGIAFATKAPPTVPVLQTTPTPLPTATVTATATPIIHAVQAGETLLGIAIQHGTTTEEIQALNPEMNPRLLLIGQEIVLPQPTVVSRLEGGTAVSIQIEVVQIHSYRTPVGTVWLVGEVLNAGALPVENVQIEVGLLNESGEHVASVRGWVATPIIRPETTAPFAILLNEPPDFEFETTAVVAGQTAVDLGSRYLNLIATDVTLDNGANSIILRGAVQNIGSETADQPTLIATFYDAQERITGFAQLTMPENLAAGQSVPFTLETTPPGGTAVSVKTFLIGRQLPVPVDNEP